MSEFDAFQALSFDCYGTLIDWETGIAGELQPWAARHGIATTREDLLGAFADYETGVESDHPTACYPDILAMTLDRVAEHLGIAASEDGRRSFGASVGRWPAFPDSAVALARLQQRYQLIILSNVDRASFAASNERLGIDFDLVLTAEDVGSYKPSTRNFAALFEALGSLGVTKDGLLHVAQSLYHDHEPASALGLPSVWIDRRHDADGYGATPSPGRDGVEPRWRFESMAAFAAAAVPSEPGSA